MKLVTLTKLASASLAAIFAVALVGCGSNDNLTLTQGNWSIAAVSNGDDARQNAHQKSGKIKSNASEADFYIGGNLTQTGSNVAGTMYIVDNTSECLTSSSGIAFTGTVKGTQVTLISPALEGQIITITASGTSTSTTTSLTGTYAVTGTGCDVGDTGTLTANLVAPISGTWSGNLPCGFVKSGGICAPSIAIDMTQAAAASDDGTVAITGTVAYTGSQCSVSGTITGGFIVGQYVTLNVNTVEVDGSTGSFTYDFALVDNPTTPANMTGVYSLGNDSFCAPANPQNLTLSLQ